MVWPDLKNIYLLCENIMLRKLRKHYKGYESFLGKNTYLVDFFYQNIQRLKESN